MVVWSTFFQDVQKRCWISIKRSSSKRKSLWVAQEKASWRERDFNAQRFRICLEFPTPTILWLRQSLAFWICIATPTSALSRIKTTYFIKSSERIFDRISEKTGLTFTTMPIWMILQMSPTTPSFLTKQSFQIICWRKQNCPAEVMFRISRFPRFSTAMVLLQSQFCWRMRRA